MGQRPPPPAESRGPDAPNQAPVAAWRGLPRRRRRSVHLRPGAARTQQCQMPPTATSCRPSRGAGARPTRPPVFRRHAKREASSNEMTRPGLPSAKSFKKQFANTYPPAPHCQTLPRSRKRGPGNRNFTARGGLEIQAVKTWAITAAASLGSCGQSASRAAHRRMDHAVERAESGFRRRHHCVHILAAGDIRLNVEGIEVSQHRSVERERPARTTFA